MSVVIDKGRYAYDLSSGRRRRLRREEIDARAPAGDCINIGLINNMPDSALEGTELQFLRLLDAAAENTFVRLRLFALPDVPRSDWGRRHLDRLYSGIEDLFNSEIDGVIMTGTEPRAPCLADEPYWNALADVIDWAEDATVSSIFSCLAAHAAVLHIDGIERHALAEKCFGLFDQVKVSEHALTKSAPSRVRFPHSRWNGIPEDALTSCGYQILTRSAEAGVDSFVKHRKSLFLFFQGHPEYEPQTLLKEYRRDVERFLTKEKDVYPGMPQGYFDQTAMEALIAFRERALSNRRKQLLSAFPEVSIARKTASWGAAATRIYRNWLTYISEQKALKAKTTRATASCDSRQRRSRGPAATELCAPRNVSRTRPRSQ
jgi:homoserine O-succinyltransferase